MSVFIARTGGVRIPDADSRFGGWWATRVPGEGGTQVLPASGEFIAPTVIEPAETSDATQLLGAAVRAAEHSPRGRTMSQVVDLFRELVIARFITLELLALTLVMLVLFGAESGWWSEPVRLLVIASLLCLVSIACSHARPEGGRVPWFRKVVAVLCIIAGIVFMLGGVAVGAVQYAYIAVHATGLI
ncbi:MAG TPA: hypothetical protein VLA88_01315 [Candidatus Saccharimonadales bacterium]|nr:hypothetical protein [Candidatus Saccharimonadales bacterium]